MGLALLESPFVSSNSDLGRCLLVVVIISNASSIINFDKVASTANKQRDDRENGDKKAERRQNEERKNVMDFVEKKRCVGAAAVTGRVRPRKILSLNQSIKA